MTYKLAMRLLSPVVLLAMVTSAGMTIGGNTALLAESPDEAQLNETQREGLVGEDGNLEEFDRETNTDDVPKRVRQYVMKPTFHYTIWVADTFSAFVYQTSLPVVVYQVLAALPAVGGVALAGLRIVNLLRRVRQ